jgi:hypothetical protein
MIIKIDSSTTLNDINESFNRYYPYLKMKFYAHAHRNQEASDENDIITHNPCVYEISKTHFVGNLKFHYWQKTGIVEQEIRNKAGLNVQILRQKGNDWIQTVGTDELTLEEQNEIGKISTEDMQHGTNRIFEREKKL